MVNNMNRVRVVFPAYPILRSGEAEYGVLAVVSRTTIAGVADFASRIRGAREQDHP